MGQLQLSDIPNSHCRFSHRLDDGDNHCNGMQMGRKGYDTIAEDSPDIDTWLASVRGIGLMDVVAQRIQLPVLPDFIPTVRRGSNKLFTQYQPEYVCVLLGEVVSAVKLEVAKDLNVRFGAPLGTKFILLGYGSDQLIENLWPERKAVFSELAKLGFVGVSSVNYSIWDEHPHAERLINIKRGLLTFEDWQQIGVPAIPHIYWSGYKDLDAWVEWLDKNPTVEVAAINLQTLKSDNAWATAIEQLTYFADKLTRSVHFLVTGPQKLSRIAQVKSIFPNMTLTNGYALRMAANGQLIKTDGTKSWAEFSDSDRSGISKSNVRLYEQYMANTIKRPKQIVLPGKARRLLAEIRA